MWWNDIIKNQYEKSIKLNIWGTLKIKTLKLVLLHIFEQTLCLNFTLHLDILCSWSSSYSWVAWTTKFFSLFISELDFHQKHFFFIVKIFMNYKKKSFFFLFLLFVMHIVWVYRKKLIFYWFISKKQKKKLCIFYLNP